MFLCAHELLNYITVIFHLFYGSKFYIIFLIKFTKIWLEPNNQDPYLDSTHEFYFLKISEIFWNTCVCRMCTLLLLVNNILFALWASKIQLLRRVLYLILSSIIIWIVLAWFPFVDPYSDAIISAWTTTVIMRTILVSANFARP
jgi:hypothetical protein